MKISCWDVVHIGLAGPLVGIFAVGTTLVDVKQGADNLLVDVTVSGTHRASLKQFQQLLFIDNEFLHGFDWGYS